MKKLKEIVETVMSLIGIVSKGSKMKSPKLYVIVREEFRTSYCAAQGIHAEKAFSKEHPKLSNEWDNNTVIVLGARFPQGLRDIMKTLDSEAILYSVWREEDQDEQITALACYHTGEYFKHLRLLT